MHQSMIFSATSYDRDYGFGVTLHDLTRITRSKIIERHITEVGLTVSRWFDSEPAWCFLAYERELEDLIDSVLGAIAKRDQNSYSYIPLASMDNVTLTSRYYDIDDTVKFNLTLYVKINAMEDVEIGIALGHGDSKDYEILMQKTLTRLGSELTFDKSLLSKFLRSYFNFKPIW